MLPRKDSSRIDTLELKAMIYQKLGHQRSEKYFDLLKRLLSLKISKSEFNRFCIQIIGREIVPLHNRLIRAILKNACGAKAPPVFRSSRKVGGNLSVKVSNGYQRSCLQSLHGDAFLSSPRKGRSPVNRDRKIRDRPSPLGPCGKPQSLAQEEFAFKAQEQQSATELHSLGSRPPVEMASVEEGEEVEQMAGSPGVQSRSPVTAPLGISMNFIGCGKTLSNVSVGRNYHITTCQNGGELPDTRSLRTHLKQKLETEQMDISVDGVNLLNNALDVYLKRLIEPCLSFSQSRCERSRFTGHQLITGSRYAFQEQLKHRAQQPNNVSLLDFHVAMQLNPELLGKDWMIQLEKVSLQASEE
ncbi:uncharacterized protein LOC111017698 [Momordica charantia]|uniref:Uncharacterized protein LOC111017698 n=1 Tax=Momordica charantia TaxID=3673 RepID=A0A6J1D555_MOMCH|nr:uncharacterized protein LOC111017698 [Momordica charantia]XP_022149224.1 uncharacterized protein LOC111017698 [Momordica charantia]XP_022149225.1 uncharacterized protein LOC111017698 [Momordica charantia]